jgi:hypothetical protein
MLDVPTVFVLGAGASEPYGFPTGYGLSSLVVQHLHPGSPPYNELRDMGGLEQEDILNFRRTFHYSGKNSVDAFLEHRTDLMHIGKLATARILAERESPDKLFTFGNNWLRELYNRMNSSFDTFANNKLSFVTFNYDRTVEHFFFSALSNTYNRPAAEVKTVLEHIPVVHLHGRMGFLPWQDEGQSRPYEHQINTKTLKIAAQNIKIIHEDITDGRDADFTLAKKLLAEADQILLLGFGYNPKNVSRLSISDLPAGKMKGSCVGLGSRATAAALEITNGRIELLGGDCTHFVQEVMRWK